MLAPATPQSWPDSAAGPFLAGPHDVACQHESTAAKVTPMTRATLGLVSGLKLPVPTLTLFVMT